MSKRVGLYTTTYGILGDVDIGAFKPTTQAVLTGPECHPDAAETEDWTCHGTLTWRGETYDATALYVFDRADVQDKEPDTYNWNAHLFSVRIDP